MTAAAREGRGTKLGDERGDVRQDSAAARRDQGQKNDRRRDGGKGSSASSVKQLAGGPPVAVMSASMAVVWPQLGVGAGGTSGANGAALVPEGPEQGLRRRPAFSTLRLASAALVGCPGLLGSAGGHPTSVETQWSAGQRTPVWEGSNASAQRAEGRALEVKGKGGVGN